LEIENAGVIRPPLYLQLGKNLETTEQGAIVPLSRSRLEVAGLKLFRN
jgi:hypothetical protein